jgi:hypothetical protein
MQFLDLLFNWGDYPEFLIKFILFVGFEDFCNFTVFWPHLKPLNFKNLQKLLKMAGLQKSRVRNLEKNRTFFSKNNFQNSVLQKSHFPTPITQFNGDSSIQIPSIFK